MKTNLGFAAVIALGLSGGVAGVGALDAAPNMVGAYADLTIQVLQRCDALHRLGDPISFYFGGSGAAENALRVIGASAEQMIAPMTRPLGFPSCSPTEAQRAGAEGMVVALQSASVVVNGNTAGGEGFD